MSCCPVRFANTRDVSLWTLRWRKSEGGETDPFPLRRAFSAKVERVPANGILLATQTIEAANGTPVQSIQAPPLRWRILDGSIALPDLCPRAACPVCSCKKRRGLQVRQEREGGWSAPGHPGIAKELAVAQSSNGRLNEV